MRLIPPRPDGSPQIRRVDADGRWDRRAGGPLRCALLAAAIAAALLVAACGEGQGAAEAVEAREQNTVELDGLEYRVPVFRQLNPRIVPDRSFYDGPRPPDGTGVYAAFLQVCNHEGPPATPSGRIVLEDAFGERFRPVDQPGNELAYAPKELRASECLPQAGAPIAAEGAPLVFLVPFADTRERPMVLVIEGTHGDARVELDL